MKLWSYLFILVGLAGCAGKAWVIRRTPSDGIIGYTNRTPPEEVQKLIPCQSELVSDDLKSRDEQYVAQQSQTNRVGNQYQTTTVPVVRTNTRTWREYSYRCIDTPSTYSKPHR